MKKKPDQKTKKPKKKKRKSPKEDFNQAAFRAVEETVKRSE